MWCDVITPVCCEDLKDIIISFSDVITSVCCEHLKDKIIYLTDVTTWVCCEYLKDRIISLTESWFVQTLHNNVYQVWPVYAGFDCSYCIGPKRWHAWLVPLPKCLHTLLVGSVQTWLGYGALYFQVSFIFFSESSDWKLYLSANCLVWFVRRMCV